MTTLGVLGASPASADPAAPDVPGWKELSDAVRALPAKLLATLPEDRRQDPQVQQEVAQLAMESLAVALIDALGGDGDHPMFVPNQNLVLNFPMPNADTVYRTARLTPGGTYRLRGNRGSLNLASLVQIGGRPSTAGSGSGQAATARPTLDLNSLKADKSGQFDLLISPAQPVGYTGDWWQLGEGANSLLLRLVSADWHRENDPTISIERVDQPTRLDRPSAQTLEAKLRALPRSMEMLPTMFAGHFEKLRSKGVVNHLEAFDISQAGGLAGQSYYEGVFELNANEALLMEVKAPKHCAYWSMILGDDLHRTLDWANNHSSLNNVQGKVDSDGILRFVVADQDPGVSNWLDTGGHRQGVIQGRWLGCTETPVPTVSKVAFGDLRAHLPKDLPTVTPAERDAIIRDRRMSVQHRRLW
ncbi:MAG: DUF1214 domain-containing protein [Sphingobium sp.]